MVASKQFLWIIIISRGGVVKLQVAQVLKLLYSSAPSQAASKAGNKILKKARISFNDPDEKIKFSRKWTADGHDQLPFHFNYRLTFTIVVIYWLNRSYLLVPVTSCNLGLARD
jgi:hypothetical protein